jgi:hypothetical protein
VLLFKYRQLLSQGEVFDHQIQPRSKQNAGESGQNDVQQAKSVGELLWHLPCSALVRMNILTTRALPVKKQSCEPAVQFYRPVPVLREMKL